MQIDETLRTQRDQAEIQRSAMEAAKVGLTPIEVERYLDPPANTPFGLEYAYYLLGNIAGKTVLDFGCGSGENLIPLIRRGANVIGIDISPDLIKIAEARLANAGLKATLKVASAYETGLGDESIDVVFCMALLHHLELPKVRDEVYRILRPGGLFILKEPIRFSRLMAFLRGFFPPPKGDISEFEHPMTHQEVALVTRPFTIVAEQDFRLPFVPLLARWRTLRKKVWTTDRWILNHFPVLGHFATGKVMCLTK